MLEDFWRRYKKSRVAVAGLLLFTPLVLLALLSPYIAPYDPMSTKGQPLRPPDLHSPNSLGTDDLGRDILSRVVFGARTSLMVGFAAIAVSSTIGILVGCMSGYFGGKSDEILMRVTEVFQVIPRFFLALILLFVAGPSIITVIGVIGVLSWPSTARLVRAEFLSLKEREFTEAARAIGKSDPSIIFGEILPNALHPVIINSSLEIPHAILIEAALSFMGVGDPTAVSWGQMLQKAMPYLRDAWWMAVFPGCLLFVALLSLNLIGDGLNDALNPKLKER